MQTVDLKMRSREYALAVIALFAKIPRKIEAQIIGRQLLRSGTSAGAQYREAVRAKSVRDFISKIEGTLQELEESEYWLELLSGSGLMSENKLASLSKKPES